MAQNQAKPLAVVNGQPIYEQDLMSIAGPRLLELRNQVYKTQSDALNALIRKSLLDAEAKRRGITLEQLLDQEVNSKVPEPSQEKIRGYFLAIENHGALSFDVVEPQIKQFIKNAERQELRTKFEDLLRAKAEISILLEAPSVEVTYDPARVMGNPNAPVTIVEFGDFQCPFCQKAEATMKAVLAKYEGRVRLAYLDFPLSEIHGQAAKAAEASRCAGDQAKFWEFHDMLFADPGKLEESSLIEHARQLHLDENAFRACLSSGKFKREIEANREQGIKIGVNGTPSYFINGTFLSGIQTEAEFAQVIDQKLASQGKAHFLLQ